MKSISSCLHLRGHTTYFLPGSPKCGVLVYQGARAGWKCYRYGLCVSFLGDEKLLWFVRGRPCVGGETLLLQPRFVFAFSCWSLFLGFLFLNFSLVGKPKWCWLGHFESVTGEMGTWLLSLLGTWYDSQCSVIKNGIMMLKYISLVASGHIDIYLMIAGLIQGREKKAATCCRS